MLHTRTMCPSFTQETENNHCICPLLTYDKNQLTLIDRCFMSHLFLSPKLPCLYHDQGPLVYVLVLSVLIHNVWVSMFFSYPNSYEKGVLSLMYGTWKQLTFDGKKAPKISIFYDNVLRRATILDTTTARTLRERSSMWSNISLVNQSNEHGVASKILNM